MNTTLWIIQGLLAVIFAASGTVILLFKEKLSGRLSWLKEYPPSMVTFICLSKIAGAIGLVAPMLTTTLPILTPIAALGIATTMALAFTYHIRKKEYKDMPATILFFALAVFIAFNRF